jgi:hypothetical protein
MIGVHVLLTTSTFHSHDPAEVLKKGGILLANLLQSSRSTFSRGSLLSFFAFKEGRLGTPISLREGWPTVSGRYPCTRNERPKLGKVGVKVI